MSAKFYSLIENSSRTVNLHRVVSARNCANEKGLRLSRRQFEVDYNPATMNRAIHDKLEEEIKTVWESSLEHNPKIYNGKKFRFSGITSHSTLNETNTPGPEAMVICVNLGDTCYRDIIGTTQNPNVSCWIRQGEIEGDSNKYMSNGLGSGTLAFTNDNHLILIRRAEWTAEYPRLLDRPGGHPEPDNIFLPGGSLKNSGFVDIDKAIAEELWNSPLDELEAEVGIVGEEVEFHSFLGVVVNKEFGRRPSLEFTTKVNMNAMDVSHRYSLRRHSEADESTSLVLLSMKQVESLMRAAWQNFYGESSSKMHQSDREENEGLTLLEDLTPALKTALVMYRDSE